MKVYHINFEELGDAMRYIFGAMNNSDSELIREKEGLKAAICEDYNIHRNNCNYYYEMERDICEPYLDLVDGTKTEEEFKKVLYAYYSSKYANHLAYFKSLFSSKKGISLYAVLPLVIKYKMDIIETQSLMDVELLVARLVNEIKSQDINKGVESLTLFNTTSLLSNLKTRERQSDKVEMLRNLANSMSSFMSTKDVISWDELVRIIKILDIAVDTIVKNDIDSVWDLFDGMHFDKPDGYLDRVEQKLSRVRM